MYGRSIIAGEPVQAAGDARQFRGMNPANGSELEPDFTEASKEQIDQALARAEQAFHVYRRKKPEEIAAFLEAIATEIEALGDELLQRANEETALPLARLTGERGRTTGQLRMFAELVREGSWVEATIDRAEPERKPLPKPDLRRMLIPLGPVVVFGASNFPLAFSVAGGDTASALAAGNPVVVKAHPSHPGTSELVAGAIVAAARKTNMPDGVFALVHGINPEVSVALVEHSATKAVGFTGSQRAGRALFDAGARRAEPIPVYAEMGSTNPVFVLPGALRENAEQFADGLTKSVTLGVGQFCTNPGLVVGLKSESMEDFVGHMNNMIASAAPATMLNAGILRSYEQGIERLRKIDRLQIAQSATPSEATRTQAAPHAFSTDAETFLAHHEHLSEEVFGPSTVIISCRDRAELEKVAESLAGHLTATIYGTPEDLVEYAWLVALLENKVGRLLFNNFPTGVEVAHAMQHGGPYPATTDARSTSVGSYAIKRFARPLCYQNFPQEALPLELRDRNERGIWRLVDGKWTKE